MFELLNECSDFELLKANLSTEQLCSIESILSSCGDGSEPEAGEGIYSLVVDWFIGNIEVERLIESILSMDDSNDSILDKFGSVEIKNNTRLSDEDAEFCMKHQALYEKVHAHYLEMYARLQAIKRFDNEFNESITDDNTNSSGGSSHRIYTKQFFKFDKDELMELIVNIDNIFIKQINNYFREKYKITIEDKDALNYLAIKEPKEPKLPSNYFRLKDEEKAVYKLQKQEHKAAYRRYVDSIIGAKLHYDCIVDDIFLLLGAFTFAEQAEKEIKDDVLAAVKRSYEIRSRKIAFDILSSHKDGNEYEVRLDGQDYKSLLRALSYFDSNKRNTAIYDGWLSKFVEYKRKEKDGIYETHSVNGSKVTSFRFYKNGKFEVEFTNHKTALGFAHEFLGHREG